MIDAYGFGFRKTSMRAVDKNALVGLVTRGHRKKVTAAKSFIGKGVWVSTLVVIQATLVLTAVYQLTHPEIATCVGMLLHHRDLAIQDSDSIAAALEHYLRCPSLASPIV